MEVALSSHQSMVVAPQLYPRHEIPQPIESEARGPPELLLYVGHVINWASFLDAQHLLVWDEVGEELISHPYPFHLLKGGDIMPVVDLEGMLKVLFPTRTLIFGGHPHRITEQSSHLTALLRRGTLGAVAGGMLGGTPEGRSPS